MPNLPDHPLTSTCTADSRLTIVHNQIIRRMTKNQSLSTYVQSSLLNPICLRHAGLPTSVINELSFAP